MIGQHISLLSKVFTGMIWKHKGIGIVLNKLYRWEGLFNQNSKYLTRFNAAFAKKKIKIKNVLSDKIYSQIVILRVITS